MLLRICYGKVKNSVTCGENLPFVEIYALWRGYYLYSLWNFYPKESVVCWSEVSWYESVT